METTDKPRTKYKPARFSTVQYMCCSMQKTEHTVCNRAESQNLHNSICLTVAALTTSIDLAPVQCVMLSVFGISLNPSKLKVSTCAACCNFYSFAKQQGTPQVFVTDMLSQDPAAVARYSCSQSFLHSAAASRHTSFCLCQGVQLGFCQTSNSAHGHRQRICLRYCGV